MEAVEAQLDDMSSHMKQMAANQKRASTLSPAQEMKHKQQRRRKKRLEKEAQEEEDAEAAALLARAKALVDAAKNIELPDFSKLFAKQHEASEAMGSPGSVGSRRSRRRSPKKSSRKRPAPSQLGDSSPIRTSHVQIDASEEPQRASPVPSLSPGTVHRNTTIEIATSRMPHHREGGIDMSQVKNEPIRETTEERSRRLRLEAKKRVQAHQRRERAKAAEQQQAQERARERQADESETAHFLAQARAAAAHRNRARKRKEAQRRREAAQRRAAEVAAREQRGAAVDEFWQLTQQRVEEKQAARKAAREREKERRRQQRAAAAAKQRKLEAEKEKILARQMQLMEETKRRLVNKQRMTRQREQEEERRVERKLAAYLEEKMQVREEVARMQQKAVANEALWATKQQLEATFDGGEQAMWSVAEAPKARRVDLHGNEPLPIRFAFGGDNGMGTAGAQEPAPSPEPQLKFPAHRELAEEARAGSSASPSSPGQQQQQQQSWARKHEVVVLLDRTAHTVKVPPLRGLAAGGGSSSLPPLPQSAGPARPRRSARTQGTGSAGSQPSTAPNGSTSPLRGTYSSIMQGDMPPEASDMYDELALLPEEMSSERRQPPAMQRSPSKASHYSKASRVSKGSRVSKASRVSRASKLSKDSRASRPAHASSKRSHRRVPVWKQAPIQIPSKEEFRDGATVASTSRYSDRGSHYGDAGASRQPKSGARRVKQRGGKGKAGPSSDAADQVASLPLLDEAFSLPRINRGRPAQQQEQQARPRASPDRRW